MFLGRRIGTLIVTCITIAVAALATLGTTAATRKICNRSRPAGAVRLVLASWVRMFA